MAQATQLRLTQITGSLGTGSGQVTDQSASVATGSANLSDVGGILSSLASAIKRIHGHDSFTEAAAGIFKQNLTVSGTFELKNASGASQVQLNVVQGVVSGSGALQVGGKATINGPAELTGSIFLKNVTSAPAAGAAEAVIYAQTGTLYFKNAGGTESAIGSSAAAGSTYQIQYNNAGAFAADGGLWYDTVQDTLYVTGSAVLSGDIAVNGATSADITTTTNTATVFNTNATTVNIAGGATTAVTIGGNGGTATVANPTVTLSNATNLNLSTVSAAAITHVGASGQNLTISSTNGNVLVEGIIHSGNDLTIPGNLYVQGTTTEVSSTVVVINDRVIQLGTGSTVAADTFERGVRFLYGDGSSVQTGFMGYTRDTNYFVFADQSTESPTDQITINRTAPISASNGRFGLIDVGGAGAGVSNSNITTVGSNPLTLLAANNNITNVANVFVVSGTAGGTPSIRLVDSNIQVRDVNDGGQQFAFTSGDGSSTRGKLETTSGATPDLILSGGQNVDIDAGATVRFQTVHMGAANKSLTLASGEVTQFNTNFNSAVSIFQAMNTLRAVKAVKVIDSTYNNGTILSSSAMVTGDGTAFNTWWTTKATPDVTTRNDRVSVYYNGQLLLSQSYAASTYDYTFNHTSADVTFNFSMTTDDIAIVKVE